MNSAGTHCFLLEIGTEELPPHELAGLAASLATLLRDGLAGAGLAEGIESRFFAGPRRLAVLIDQLPACQADRQETRMGPPVSGAFDRQGKPNQAALGFARSCGTSVEELERVETDKGVRLCFSSLRQGLSVSVVLCSVVADAIAGLPARKPMRWGAATETFVRPVHWVVALLDSEVLALEIKGIAAGRCSYGHRFHHPRAVELPCASAYVESLRGARVMVDLEERRQSIGSGLQQQAGALGLTVSPDAALLDEVTALVEWPLVISGRFDPGFLEVPAEALIACMQDHQKFFPLFQADGTLAEHFLAVVNISSQDEALMRQGYERVLAARLQDAAFFWAEDRKRSLDQYAESLHGMVYQAKLGSVADKSSRIGCLAAALAEALGGDAEQARRAGLLCKADLCTQLVGEFPELQGIAGHYYARLSGESENVALAIEEHYLPRFAADVLPDSDLGRYLALADRLDTLAGVFAAGLLPTGNKDPYGLRRAALGMVRICMEQQVDLDLRAWLCQAIAGLPGGSGLKTGPSLAEDLFHFIVERARNYAEDRQLCSKQVFSAAAASAHGGLFDLYRRALALKTFSEFPQARDLSQANKRIKNILRQAQKNELPAVEVGLLQEPAEQALYHSGVELEQQVLAKNAAFDYAGALTLVAQLHQPLARFFDQVLVMAPDPAVMDNRLALLRGLGQTMNTVGELSELSA